MPKRSCCTLPQSIIPPHFVLVPGNERQLGAAMPCSTSGFVQDPKTGDVALLLAIALEPYGIECMWTALPHLGPFVL